MGRDGAPAGEGALSAAGCLPCPRPPCGAWWGADSLAASQAFFLSVVEQVAAALPEGPTVVQSKRDHRGPGAATAVWEALLARSIRRAPQTDARSTCTTRPGPAAGGGGARQVQAHAVHLGGPPMAGH